MLNVKGYFIKSYLIYEVSFRWIFSLVFMNIPEPTCSQVVTLLFSWCSKASICLVAKNKWFGMWEEFDIFLSSKHRKISQLFPFKNCCSLLNQDNVTQIRTEIKLFFSVKQQNCIIICHMEHFQGLHEGALYKITSNS